MLKGETKVHFIMWQAITADTDTRMAGCWRISQELLSSGIARPSSSPYASPVVVMKKKNGSRRLCVDYSFSRHRIPIP